MANNDRRGRWSGFDLGGSGSHGDPRRFRSSPWAWILGFLIVTGTSDEDAQRRLEDFADMIDVKLAGQPPTTTKTPWQRMGPAHAAP